MIKKPSKDQLRSQGETAMKSGVPVKVCTPSKRKPQGKRARYTNYCSSRMTGKVN